MGMDSNESLKANAGRVHTMSELLKVNTRVPKRLWADVGQLAKDSGMKREAIVSLAIREAMPILRAKLSEILASAP